MMRQILLLITLLFFSVSGFASNVRINKLVNLNFEYVRLVKLVSDDCLKTTQKLLGLPDSQDLWISAMGCYSFLLEKREKLEREVLIPLRRLKFPQGELTQKEKDFVALVYVADDNIEEIAKQLEPLIKKHRFKKKRK